MEPTAKTPQMEWVLQAITGKNRVETIRDGKCMTCNRIGITPESFWDAISRKEYTISGMCQTCQDKTFGEDPFDISQDF